MSARIVTLDVETQRGVVETWGLWKPFIGIDRVVVPSRLLCFAATWYGEEKMIFKSAWADGDEDSYRKMLQAAWDILDRADYVVTYNGTRFDLQWFQAEFSRLGMGRPTPYKSVDLFQVNKRHFSAGQMSLKLDWSARCILRDAKVPHPAGDLWHAIRYGTRDERRAAQNAMKRYCIHDVELTEKLFEQWRPWLNINVAIYEDDSGISLRCTKCGSTNLKKDGVKYHNTLNSLYQIHRCKDCGGSSRGAQVQARTPLRPI